MVMVFSSLQFIFIFMPIFFGCYYIVPDKLKNSILFIGSLCFYFVGTIHNPEHFIVFILSIIADFVVGVWIEKFSAHKKVLLTIGISLHLISLAAFKYSGFVINEIGRLNPSFNFTADIVLPIGISFYTFQGISYIVDVYRGTTKAQQSLLKYTIYISMFEQLIAGPIVTYGQVEKELYKRQIKTSSVLRGIGIFIFGLGLKVLLANPIGKLWSQTCAIGFESISTPLAWMAIIAFSFQIYFDFSGYSDMAVGLGRMFGFEFMENFRYPYISKSITEFWRRWHISLSTGFREYLYIPLGGNRCKKSKWIFNLFIVWAATGIWHGASWNYLLWGLFFFVVLV